jgi:hypothetical protein
VLNWQHRVAVELNCNRNWKREWGFLAQGTEADSLDLFRSQSGTVMPAATYIAAHKRRDEAAGGRACGDAPDTPSVPAQTSRDITMRR